jgi:hypothetical protein
MVGAPTILARTLASPCDASSPAPIDVEFQEVWDVEEWATKEIRQVGAVE